MSKQNVRKELINLGMLFIACLFGAFGMHVFVYPSSFAPIGVDGIATMLQELTKVNAGVYTIALNVPLFIMAWFVLKRRYVVYTIIFTILTSILLMVLDVASFWQYVTETDRRHLPEFMQIMKIRSFIIRT